MSEHETAILDLLRERGASFFGPLHDAVGGGYPGETVDALWNLVWQGLITNDTFHALRAFTRTHAPRRRVKIRQPAVAAFRSRRLAPPSAEGRWTLLPTAGWEIRATNPSPDVKVRAQRGSATEAGRAGSAGSARAADTTKWAAAVTQQLLARHGIVTREAVAADEVAGGFGIVYPVLKGMEEHGRIRRGYFVAGLGATQFAMPGALDLLRSLRDAPDDPEVVVLAATDPANPYGAALRWPKKPADHDAAVRRRSGRFGGRGSRPDPQRRRNGDPRQRRPRRLSAARRSTTRHLPARRRTGSIPDRSRAGAGADRPGTLRRPSSRHADRGDRRRAAAWSSADGPVD